MENLEKILSRARKLKELANRGVDGEKETAIATYNAYLKKYNLQDSDINTEMNKRVIPAKDRDYIDLLLNVILSVNPYAKHTDLNNSIECYLDNEDYTEVLQKYEYFSKMLQVEKELLISAFLLKHQDFFQPDEHSKTKWRERRVENDAFKIKDQETEIIREELKKMQTQKNVADSVIQSGDRLKIAAFNINRTEEMMKILLNSKYIRSNKRINGKKNTQNK